MFQSVVIKAMQCFSRGQQTAIVDGSNGLAIIIVEFLSSGKWKAQTSVYAVFLGNITQCIGNVVFLPGVVRYMTIIFLLQVVTTLSGKSDCRSL